MFKSLLPSLVGKELFGISFGFLIIVDKKKKMPDSQIWFLNPFTRHELRFLCPPNRFQYATLASLATALPEFIIMSFLVNAYTSVNPEMSIRLHINIISLIRFTD